MRKHRGHGRILAGVASLVVVSAGAGAASAQEAMPSALSLSGRETVDFWDNAAGGVRTGGVILNKAQVEATLDGDAVGLPGVTFQAQVFRTDGASLSARVGDIQTVSNIEAGPMTRLFEAWVEKTFGGDDHSLSLRAGLMDLNADFDSIDVAGAFVNSSHGIGPDLSRSGRNGPSIFPVSSLGLRALWSPSKVWTLKAAVFDGVSGDPADPAAFVRVRLRGDDGILAIAEADYHLSGDTTLQVGAWGYSQPLPAIGNPAAQGHDRGVYASLAGPIPGADRWSGWIRGGLADDTSQIVDGYLGAGLVRKSPLSMRPDDQLGVAVAHATTGVSAQTALRLYPAETTIEAFYLLQVRKTVSIQPDIQYVVEPTGHSGARNAVAVGLRFTFTAG
jgi:porin